MHTLFRWKANLTQPSYYYLALCHTPFQLIYRMSKQNSYNKNNCSYLTKWLTLFCLFVINVLMNLIFLYFLSLLMKKKNKRIQFLVIYFCLKVKVYLPLTSLFLTENKYRLQFSKFSDVILVKKIRLVEQSYKMTNFQSLTIVKEISIMLNILFTYEHHKNK